MSHIWRRDIIVFGFIALLLAPNLVAAQSKPVFEVGLLVSKNVADEIDVFIDQMRRLGYEEGRNLVLHVRRTETPQQNPVLAAELVALKPDVLLAAGSQQVDALKNATVSIPIVFTWVSNPVGLGIVESLAKPGHYITGIANYNPEINGKRLQLISEVVPSVARIGFLFDPSNSASILIMNQTEAAATMLHLVLVPAPARAAQEVLGAMQQLVNEKVGAVIVGADLVLSTNYETIISFAIENHLPTIFFLPRHVKAGGLMSYGVDPADMFRRAAAYVDKILRGANPADLPVENPTSLHLVVNLQTARALDLSIPQSILLRADDVIE